ncbi:MAG: Ig-like domain-containing protein [Blastocatellia bacterium]|nr:Ig-like domain-containing protein [Blastocatellia bacterium]
MRKLYVGIRFWSVVASFVLVVGLFSSEARTIRSASLREALSTGIVSQIVGDDGSSPPVVNESKSLRLHVEDANGSRLVVRSWRTDSPAVARVSKKGALKGLLYGFATISATVDSGEVVTETVVVSRVTPRGGMPATGDLKSDLAGNVYLTDPLRHVLFRSTGVRDELYAGVSGSAGHSNGAGRSARFHSPTGLAIDTRPDGGLFVADSANHCIRRVSFTGVVSDALGTPTLPGVMLDDEQQLSAAKFDGPQGLALLGRDFIVADTNNHALFYADLDADGTGVIYRIGGSPGSAGIVDAQDRIRVSKLRQDWPSTVPVRSSRSLTPGITGCDFCGSPERRAIGRRVVSRRSACLVRAVRRSRSCRRRTSTFRVPEASPSTASTTCTSWMTAGQVSSRESPMAASDASTSRFEVRLDSLPALSRVEPGSWLSIWLPCRQTTASRSWRSVHRPLIR